MNKLVYPFKKFVRNLILGLSLVFLAFTILPLTSFILNKVDEAVDAAPSLDTYNFYAYRYTDSGDIEECGTWDWTEGALWWADYHGSFSVWNKEGGNIIYLSTESSKPDYKSGTLANAALKGGKKQITVDSTENKKYYAYCENSSVTCLGFFGTDWNLAKPNFTSIASASNHLLSLGNEITLGTNTPHNIYMLFTHQDYTTNINFTPKLYLNDDYTWQSNFMGNPTSTLSFGWKDGAKSSSFQMTGYNNVKIGYEDAIDKTYTKSGDDVVLGTKIFAFIGKNGSNKTLEFYDASNPGQSFSLNINPTTTNSGKTRTYNLDLLYQPTQSNNKIKYEDGEVIFNIYNATDWNKFADEVNKGYMNSFVGGKYKAVLQQNLGASTNILKCVGLPDSPFMGEFDGQGNTLGDVKLDVSQLAIYSEQVGVKTQGVHYTVIERYYEYGLQKYCGLFSVVSNDNSIKKEIKNFNIKGLSVSEHYGDSSIRIAGVSPNETEVVIGGVFGKVKGYDISNINITSINLCFSFFNRYKIDLNIGGIVGKAENTNLHDITCDSCSLANGGIFSSSPQSLSLSVSTLNPAKIGGGIASFDGGEIENVNIETYNLKNINQYSNYEKVTMFGNVGGGCTYNYEWPKHDDSKFYAGGLIGYDEAASVTNCYVNGGTQELSGVYYTSLDNGREDAEYFTLTL